MHCDYIFAVAINARLAAIAAPWQERAENKLKPSRPKVRRFHQFAYKADSWSKAEKVIARVEATKLGKDTRFVMPEACASSATKTACPRWEAHQFRLFLDMGAYWLLHSLRLAAPRRSRWRGATAVEGAR